MSHQLDRMRTLPGLLLGALLLAPGIPAPVLAQHDITDAGITTAIEEEHILDAVVPFNDVEVTTLNGVVTLTGRVPHLGAKRHAERVAESVKGVRSVVNRIVVEPMSRTGHALRNSVTEALTSDPATDQYELTVLANDEGQVTLNGVVDSWAERNLAERVAASVAGVTGIDNRIEIDSILSRADAEIETEIEERLRWDTIVDDGLIDVSVEDGIVSLSGIVGSASEARRARSDAWVEGVQAVEDSELRVARWARDEDMRARKYADKSDAEIAVAIEDALLYDPRVESFDVTVSVQNGNVSLRGTVDNLKAKRAATRDARNTVGVNAVRNYMRIRPTVEHSDETIADDVRDAFARDAIVDGETINVEVENGVATLRGSVDSVIEKSQAEDVASRVAGITHVENQLATTRLDPYIGTPYASSWYPYSYSYFPDDYATLSRDERIENEIRGQIFWSPFVDGDDVDVTVERGTATLDGTVGSWREHQAAIENAYEGGAESIEDNLTIAVAG